MSPERGKGLFPWSSFKLVLEWALQNGLTVPRPAGFLPPLEAASQIQYPIHSAPYSWALQNSSPAHGKHSEKKGKLLFFVMGSLGRKKRETNRNICLVGTFPMHIQGFQGVENNQIGGQTLGGPSHSKFCNPQLIQNCVVWRHNICYKPCAPGMGPDAIATSGLGEPNP